MTLETDAEPPPSTPARGGRTHPAVVALLGLLVAIVAFVPRTDDLGSALMIDEALWLDRSERFVDAVADLRLGAAFTTGHPGVTTMWIGGIAQRTLPPGATLTERYERARLAMAIVGGALLMALWWLLRRVVGEAGALACALLVGFDPFLLAHTRVLHLDGLHALTTFVSIAALLRYRSEERAWQLRVSGVVAGLALLTRTLTSAPLLAVAVLLLRKRGWRQVATWAGIAAATFVVAWPLLWVRPWKAVWLLGWGAARAATAESDAGRFFLGRAVNPGPWYYPVVFAFRSTIVTLPGAVGAAIWGLLRRRREPEAARIVLWALAFALGSALLLTVADKKADRYVLPSLLAADVAVAVALVRLLRERAALLGPVLALTVALHAAPALALHPFELAHFNWAAGGPQVARRAFAIGRGEGLETAARQLNRIAPGATIATSRLTQFEEFYAGRTVSLAAVPGDERPDYVLFYISSVQTNRFPAWYARYAGREPFYTLEINGLPYVRVWVAQE